MAEATRPSADDAAGRALIEEPPMVEFLKRLFEVLAVPVREEPPHERA